MLGSGALSLVMRRCPLFALRNFCSPAQKTEGELKIEAILKQKFPKAVHLEANDVSGGCGSMYEVHIHAQDFKGMPKIQQHRLVNQALNKEISDMHGVRIFTKIPESEK